MLHLVRGLPEVPNCVEFWSEIDENVQIFPTGFFAHFRQNLGYFCSVNSNRVRVELFQRVAFRSQDETYL
jgi:hypothetical protein